MGVNGIDIVGKIKSASRYVMALTIQIYKCQW